MSASKFTDGPWTPLQIWEHVDGVAKSDGDWFFYARGGRRFLYAAGDGNEDAVTWADAHLMAASPALYEALKEALRIASEPPEHADLSVRETDIVNWKRAAREALRRAEREREED